MTTTQQFIEDAIKGGWGFLPRINKHASRCEITGDNVDLYYRDNFHETTVQAILLDPLAWQAVGKTRGWDFAYCYQCHTKVMLWAECECDEDEVTPIAKMGWHFKWVAFIDTLAEGKTIEESLQAISNQI
jgi:hypothetical protein